MVCVGGWYVGGGEDGLIRKVGLNGGGSNGGVGGNRGEGGGVWYGMDDLFVDVLK